MAFTPGKAATTWHLQNISRISVKVSSLLMVENSSNILKSQEDARKVKEQVLKWMSSYNAPIAQRRWEKQLEDLEKLVTPKDIQAFDKSDLVRNAISTLGQCMGM